MINDVENFENLITPIFNEIFHVCDNKFMNGCGSYLFDGRSYKYCNLMFDKQKLLFELATKSESVLEIGTYMGHSLLIMLLANPKLKATCIDIDDRFSKPSINLLKNKFPDSEINFICGNSLDILPSLSEKFDLFHIDGHHSDDFVIKEFNYCKNLNKTNIMKIIFDDANTCKQSLEKIYSQHKIINQITPNCAWNNTYIEIEI